MPTTQPGLPSLLARPALAADEGILSVLPPEERDAHYDTIAGFYDAVIASSPYNRLLWGNTPADYAAFTAEGLSDSTGPVLDAGCGSLVFTAPVYAESTTPILLMDRSLGMLRRARDRLEGEGERLLLQADLYDLPFADGSFDRVFHFAIAHVLEDRVPVFRELRRVLAPGGRLYLTSVVRGSARGDAWARLLHALGELARPYETDQLLDELRQAGFQAQARVQASGAYVTAEPA